MKIYFMSDIAAALKLNGEYAGIIDGFGRYCEVDAAAGTLCEIVPDGNLQPVNFFVNENFFRSANSFAEVYLSRTFNTIYVRSFYPKDASLKLIMQRKFENITVTIYRQCGLFLCCDGTDIRDGVKNHPLPWDFAEPYAEEVRVCGKKLMAIYGGRWLALIDKKGNLLFLNEAESHSFGDILEVTLPLHTCESSIAECSFALDGEAFKAVNCTLLTRSKPCADMLAFIFFERVLWGADYTALLCEELKPRAGSLKKYLGNFVGVNVPDEDFYINNSEKHAAGLVYKKDKNLYEIIYYAIDEENGRITNVRPV